MIIEVHCKMIDLVSPWHIHMFIPSIDIIFTRLCSFDLCWLFGKDCFFAFILIHVFVCIEKKIEIYDFHFYPSMTSNQAIAKIEASMNI